MSEFDKLRGLIAHHEAYGDPELAPDIEELSGLLDARDEFAADLAEMEEAWRAGDAVEKAVSDPARQAELEARIDALDDEIRFRAFNLFGN